MAGDWIKMRANLQTHPKVVRISSALQADRLRVIGGLHAVWCLFDEHSDDGHLHGYTPGAVDGLIGWAGFSDALIALGWLKSDGNDGLVMPEFSTHNGVSAKRRAQEADRKRVERSTVRKPSASEADKKRTREEKRREEINTGAAPNGNQYDPTRRATVPGSKTKDPALAKLDDDKGRTGAPPSHIREQLKALTGVH